MKLFTKRKLISILTILTVSFLLFTIKDGSITGSVIGNKDYCKDCNVVIILIDTLRADHLSAYGYERKTSPNIDSLAEEGIIFSNTISQTSWTKPSTASILTGLYPKHHKASSRESNLPEENKLLSETLQENGYNTYAFSTNAFITEEAGFNQGFTDFFYFPRDEANGKPYAKAKEVNDKLIPFIDNLNRDSKNFIYVHYMDPHAPYEPGINKYSTPDDVDFFEDDFFSITENEFEEYQKNHNISSQEEANEVNQEIYTNAINQLINLYDDEIYLVDKRIGEVITTFKKKGIFDNTIFIIVSDHGEEFLEHNGLTHGKTLYDEQLKVPLIIKLPSKTSSKIDKLTQQIDIVPTLLDILKISSDQNYDGINIFKEDREKTFSELTYDGRFLTALRSKDEKLIEGALYNLSSFNKWATWPDEEIMVPLKKGSNKIFTVSFHGDTKVATYEENGEFVQELIIPPIESRLEIEANADGQIIIKPLTPCNPVTIYGLMGNECLSFGIDLPENKPPDNKKIHPKKYYFDLKNDPLEKKNLFNKNDYKERIKERIKSLEPELFNHISEKSKDSEEKQTETIIFDSEELETLKALGYLN